VADKLINPSRPFYHSMPATSVLCFVFFAANVSLNSAEIILHSFFPDQMAAWLGISGEMTALTAKYVPAVSNVFFYLGHAPFALFRERAAFLQNVVAMNWILVSGFGILFTVTMLTEIFVHPRIFVATRYYDMQHPEIIARYSLLARKKWFVRSVIQNKWGFFLFSLSFWVFFFHGLFSGNLFRLTGMFWLAASDLQIPVIALLFISVEAFYLGLLVAFAQVLLLPSGKERAQFND